MANKKINEDVLNDYVKMHPNTTEAEIAKHLGISTSTVSRSYRKHHIKRRTRAKGH